MPSTHEYLATLPFDIYELSLFRLVATSGSFTKAAQQAGMTQSGITRQIQGIESQIGTPLFERTTRRVVLTAAGRFLLGRVEKIVQQVDHTYRVLQENFTAAPKTLAVGVSRSIGLAYLPGFFTAFRQKHPSVRTRVSQQSSADILTGLDDRTLHAGIMSTPERLPAGVKITHRFRDDFVSLHPREPPCRRDREPRWNSCANWPRAIGYSSKKRP
jgi:DNA-binding transcriptional LysR family regulator